MVQGLVPDALAYVLVLHSWLLWRCTQDRIATISGGITHSAWVSWHQIKQDNADEQKGRVTPQQFRRLQRKVPPMPTHQPKGLMVLQWGSAPSARVERQLRGRAGRQGDPGSSWAILSMDDESVQRSFPSSNVQIARTVKTVMDKCALILLACLRPLPN